MTMQPKALITIVAVALLGIHCSLATEFDESKLDGGSAYYSLEANILEPVDVTLLDNGNAEIALDLAEPLPDAEDSTLAALLNSAIHLTVANTETGVTTNLTQGNRTEDEPANPGEYRIIIDDDRGGVSILFRNETVAGQTLRSDGAYEATVEVTANLIFAIENFTRAVDVSDL